MKTRHVLFSLAGEVWLQALKPLQPPISGTPAAHGTVCDKLNRSLEKSKKRKAPKKDAKVLTMPAREHSRAEKRLDALEDNRTA
jgi:hypothetical protein